MKKLTVLYCITLLGLLLGIYKGKVAVWKDNDPKPAKVFPYSARLLPAADRKRLEKGIHFNTKEELTRAIEDYFS